MKLAIDKCAFCNGEAYTKSGTSIRIDVKRDTRDHYLIFSNDFTKEFGSKRIHYCPVCGRYLDGEVERVDGRCMDWYE